MPAMLWADGHLGLEDLQLDEQHQKVPVTGSAGGLLASKVLAALSHMTPERRLFLARLSGGVPQVHEHSILSGRPQCSGKVSMRTHAVRMSILLLHSICCRELNKTVWLPSIRSGMFCRCPQPCRLRKQHCVI